MIVCYVITDTGFSSIIAISKDRKKPEEKMFNWCKERGIVPEYYHGDYKFQKRTKLGIIGGWLKFEEVDEI